MERRWRHYEIEMKKYTEESKAKEKGPYRNKLTASAKQRYEEKLSDSNDDDPYELPAAEWYRDLGSHL